MAALLMYAEIEFDVQVPISGKVVDFYLPESDSVIEVDGVYWHDRAEKKKPGLREERDAVLLTAVSFVYHVTDDQLRSLGWI